jgi:hypothetical protein
MLCPDGHHISNKEIEKRLDFILSHLEEPTFFPRTIMTKKLGYQRLVYSKERALEHFIDSDFIDCRINAYPYLTEYKDVPRYKPDFLFIDLDRKNFKTKKSFELSLYNTLKNIKEKLNGYPTVLFTGGGYHIYQPVDIPTALENITEFKEFDKPSEQFLRFAKDFLSNNKADKQNNPSFRSCLLRIPGSINSKYNNRVKIVKKWIGIRAPITKDMLIEFRRYLIQKKIDFEKKQRQKILANKNRNNNNNSNSSNYIPWIEQLLLQNPIEDHRKLVIDIILAPYLINIKKLSFEESYHIIKDWLDKCNDIKKLDNYRNFEYRISCALKTANKKQIPPMSYNTLKENYEDLYSMLLSKSTNETSKNRYTRGE